MFLSPEAEPVHINRAWPAFEFSMRPIFWLDCSSNFINQSRLELILFIPNFLVVFFVKIFK